MPSSRPPRRSASASRSSSLLTSSSTMSGSIGSLRAAFFVMLMTRPNELSTTSAPCSCAMRATGNASDDSFVMPVTRMRLSSSNMSEPPRCLERCVRVTSVPLVFALGGEALQGGGEDPSRVGRRDDVVDVAALGRHVRIEEPLLVLRRQGRLLLVAARAIVDGVDAPPMEHAHRGARAHHRDLGGRPCDTPVGTEAA